MPEYDHSNRGVLFRNDRKENERQPDYQGHINVGGTEYRLSAWMREGKNGKYLSLALQQKNKPQAPKKRDILEDDDPPF